jgi:peptidoglycan/xylan/chitin deacetylase (PgdA/CDA1 family)
MNRIALLMLIACCGTSAARAEIPFAATVVRDAEGGVIRGDVETKRLALIFTGDKFGESATPILDALAERSVKGSFFLTGGFVEQDSLRPAIKRMVDEGHYVGPHSDSHPLYAPWEDRRKSLVTAEFFQDDLQKNIDGLRGIGALRPEAPILFVPPYEWYNAEQVAWSDAMGVGLINFTPGSGSNRDYAREGDRVFVPSQQILDDVLAYEQKDPHGLNGFLLLLHLGSGRRDPFHPQLGKLCDELAKRGYEFARVDELLLLPELPK